MCRVDEPPVFIELESILLTRWISNLIGQITSQGGKILAKSIEHGLNRGNGEVLETIVLLEVKSVFGDGSKGWWRTQSICFGDVKRGHDERLWQEIGVQFEGVEAWQLVVVWAHRSSYQKVSAWALAVAVEVSEIFPVVVASNLQNYLALVLLSQFPILVAVRQGPKAVCKGVGLMLPSASGVNMTHKDDFLSLLENTLKPVHLISSLSPNLWLVLGLIKIKGVE